MFLVLKGLKPTGVDKMLGGGGSGMSLKMTECDHNHTSHFSQRNITLILIPACNLPFSSICWLDSHVVASLGNENNILSEVL